MVKNTLYIFLVVLIPFLAFSQLNISGQVVEEQSGQPIYSANVSISELQTGTATNEEGKYSISIPASECDGSQVNITVSFIGYETAEKEIILEEGTKTFNFNLTKKNLKMDQLVVTGLGISQEKKELGYSTQEVSSEKLNAVPTTNFLDAMSGNVSGVDIKSASSTIGASSRIEIRGLHTLTGDGQPLFVVDGVPINNSSVGNAPYNRYGEGGSNNSFGEVVDFGNAAADISNFNIASVNVLKGANASAIYGSRAMNGVIEIETKSGETAKAMDQGIGITYNASFMARNVSILPDYQDKYGQGMVNPKIDAVAKSNASFGTFGYVNGNGAGHSDKTDQSWGPPLDGYLSSQYDEMYGNIDYIKSQGEGKPLLISQFTSPLPDGTVDPSVRSTERKKTPWVSHPDNVRNFFETGLSQVHNLAMYGGNQDAYFRSSFTEQREQGIFPNTDQKRHSLFFNGSLNITDKLQTSVVANYIKLENDNLVGNGYNVMNPMQQFNGWFGRQVDIGFLEDHVKKKDGTPYRWNYAYHDNPYWTLNENTNSRTRDRVYGHFNVNYRFNDNLSILGRYGIDYFSEDRKYRREKLSNDFPDGQFVYNMRNNFSNHANMLLKYNKQLTDDINLKWMSGAEMRYSNYNYQETMVQSLIIPDLFTTNNAASKPQSDMYKEQKETQSLFYRAKFGYKDLLFLTTTGRNDWSSALPENNWSYFYPSVSASFMFSDAFDIDPETMTGKIRASWAQVGNSADPYSLHTTYGSYPTFRSMPNMTLNNTSANPNLKPERETSYELGTDLNFFSNRLGLNLTYYKSETEDLIMDVPISSASGFDRKWVNAGVMENEGVELQLHSRILENSDKNMFWDVDVNWSKNNNTVKNLYGDTKSFEVFPGTWAGLKVKAAEGEPWGQLYGYPTIKHNGKPVINSAGIPKANTDSLEVLGNVQPDWTGGISSTFKYGPFSLDAVVDVSVGGSIFNVTYMWMMYSGVHAHTVEGNEDVEPVTGDDIRRKGGLIHDGYKMEVSDGDTSYVKNDIKTSAHTYAQSFYPSIGGHEKSVFDASYIKLRQIAISYQLPNSFVNKLGLREASVSLIGKNLALLYRNTPCIDPETSFSAGKIQGIEQHSFPSVRTYGLKLRLRL